MAIEMAQIERVASLVGRLARDDVSDRSQEALLEAHDAVARLGRLTGTLQSRFAAEISRRSAPQLPGGGLARQQGLGTAGQMVARVTGGTTAGALRSIEAGRALMVEPTHPDPDTTEGAQDSTSLESTPRYPAVAKAALVGDLSVDAAGLMTVGLAVNEVRRMVSRAVARADVVGHEAKERRQHAERYVAWKEDHTGMVTFTGKLDAVTAAPIRTVIEQMVTQAFRARGDQDPSEQDQRTVGQMRADALFEICRHALGCKEADTSGVRTTMVVRMDKADLESGVGLGAVDGTDQPVSIGQLRRLAGDAGVIPAVLGGDSDVLDLGHTVRLFTTAQRLALLERDGGCAKCHAPPEHGGELRIEGRRLTWAPRDPRVDYAGCA